MGTLADAVGDSLATDLYMGIIMPPLVKKWETLQDDDRDLFPLLEVCLFCQFIYIKCMSSVAVALGPKFSPYAPTVWARCVNLIQKTLMQIQVLCIILKVLKRQMYTQDPNSIEVPDKDFMVVSLDLLSGVAQGLGQDVEPLVTNIQPSALQLLLICMKVRRKNIILKW